MNPFFSTATGKQVLVLIGLLLAAVVTFLSGLHVSGQAQLFVSIAIFAATSLVHYLDPTIPNIPTSVVK